MATGWLFVRNVTVWQIDVFDATRPPLVVEVGSNSSNLSMDVRLVAFFGLGPRSSSFLGHGRTYSFVEFAHQYGSVLRYALIICGGDAGAFGLVGSRFR
jgi:hypothetical protein